LTFGGKPVAVILSIAVLIVATAIPIVAMKLSPTQINQPTNTALPAVMRYIIAPSSLAGRGLGVGFM
jgi:hypothetical protein